MSDEEKPAEGIESKEPAVRSDCHSLLGCPFCGQPPRVDTEAAFGGDGEEGWWAWVLCEHCHNTATEAPGDTEALAVDAATYDWNLRAIPECVKDLLDMVDTDSGITVQAEKVRQYYSPT